MRNTKNKKMSVEGNKADGEKEEYERREKRRISEEEKMRGIRGDEKIVKMREQERIEEMRKTKNKVMREEGRISRVWEKEVQEAELNKNKRDLCMYCIFMLDTPSDSSTIAYI